MPKLPGINGIAKFKGKMFHTSRWEYDYTGGTCDIPDLTKLKDKRVAIVGTGATSIQAVPHLAAYCKELYVVQRTPSCVDTRPNPPTDEAWLKSLEPGWQKQRIANFQRYAQEVPLPGEADLVCDFWTEINRNLQAWNEAEPMAEFSMEQFMERREVVDYQVMERFRRRVDETIKDPELAEQLKAYYRFLCKRPLSSDTYYPCFNQANVHLIDTSDTQGLQEITENGFKQDGTEYEVDCIIFASGFEVSMAEAASRSTISGAMARTPSRAICRAGSPTCSSSAISRARSTARSPSSSASSANIPPISSARPSAGG
jgi:cation diffusion facilitator CzcD-associated flavoprotein CzcO